MRRHIRVLVAMLLHLLIRRGVGILRVGALTVAMLGVLIRIRRVCLRAVAALWWSNAIFMINIGPPRDGTKGILVIGLALRVTGIICTVLATLLPMLEAAVLWWAIRIHSLWRPITSRRITI